MEGEPWQLLASWLEAVRSPHSSVVVVGGHFDLLHVGHIELIAAASALGDHLVVYAHGDRSTRVRKGPGRPIVPLADRARVLAGLRGVAAVGLLPDEAADLGVEAIDRLVIETLAPDVVVVVDNEEADTRAAAIASVSRCRVFRLPPFSADWSTTRLIDRIRRGPAGQAGHLL